MLVTSIFSFSNNVFYPFFFFFFKNRICYNLSFIEFVVCKYFQFEPVYFFFFLWFGKELLEGHVGLYSDLFKRADINKNMTNFE